MAGLTDLTRDFAKKFGVTQANARQCIEFLCDDIIDRASKGEVVSVRNFGVFKVKDIGPRTIKNPQTHEPTNLPASIRVCFTATEHMKNEIKKARGLVIAEGEEPDVDEDAEVTESAAEETAAPAEQAE